MIHDLTGSWTVREAESTDVPTEAAAGGEWLQALVPGCVHLDLMRAGEIPDPFYGFNDLQVQWVAEKNWLYRHTFDCPAGLRGMKKVELVCEGLDTFARVFLNGHQVARADNMFVQWRWDVTGLLKDKGNELLVLFESPNQVGHALMEQDGRIRNTSFGAGRSYTRKAQYASGWDWGPNLNTSGIWRPVCLQGCNRARLADVCARILWDDPEKPVVNVTVEVEAIEECEVTVEAKLVGENGELIATTRAALAAGPNAVELSLPVEDPQLWWPAGSGPQNLYGLTVTADMDGEELEATSFKVGLRRVELRREKDEEGESFVICVNGQPIFCKGANWVPADSFLPRLGRDDYQELLRKARDANMNMLRVWGGGIYESDEFYDACDRLGIMVWQDFAFACAGYPDHLDWFCESVRAEAEHNVRRLRNHPSLVLWCGSNECQWQHGRLPGDRAYDDILPEVCARLDPTRPYWPGSPYGGEEPNSPAQGDQHFWQCWHGWSSPELQRDYAGRFISEFGFEAPPTLETIHKYVPSWGHHMQSRVMEHHNRCPLGTERLYRFLAGSFRIPSDFEDVVYLMQLVQAESVKMAVEHWRSRKFRTAGALFWQYNDCWPVTSWSCIDYEGRPKALYYYAGRFFAPALPVIDYREGRFTVTVINDRPTDFEGELICGFGLLNGDQQWVDRAAVTVPANGVTLAQVRDASELSMQEPDRQYFWCRLLKDHEEIARNAWLLLPYKHVRLDVPEWEVQVQQIAAGQFSLELHSDTFTKGVWLRVEGVEAVPPGQVSFSDNFFDVLPEVPVRVEVRTADTLDAAQLRRRLRIRSVAETQLARGGRP